MSQYVSLREKLELVITEGKQLGGGEYFPRCLLCDKVTGPQGKEYLFNNRTSWYALCKTCLVVAPKHIIPLMDELESLKH